METPSSQIVKSMESLYCMTFCPVKTRETRVAISTEHGGQDECTQNQAEPESKRFLHCPVPRAHVRTAAHFYEPQGSPLHSKHNLYVSDCSWRWNKLMSLGSTALSGCADVAAPAPGVSFAGAGQWAYPIKCTSWLMFL